LTSNSQLEQAIDKILTKTQNNILSEIESALTDSQQNLDDFVPKLESEFDKIIADGKKEAEKIERQIVGGADIEVRNKQLIALEESVEKVFSKALEQIANTDRSGDYSNLIKTLLTESTQVLGTSEIIVLTNTKDKDVVQSALSQFPGSELSSETIDCLGGIIAKSKDGAMTFDNTINARINRLKPLIRKGIAVKFGVAE
jgi:V/A-type H+-transporting ATPase subunit E